eukprot:TRINITY_DN25525_c0_g3_i1.p1 TRINITY_DN25525_c0_g3~~TRINITY_DN25525_c0_g3_i1.p1  ORF type:complete len:540 (-),score=71.96 TRINITY_DN25525_c0_g3_i1:7-1626(-)
MSLAQGTATTISQAVDDFFSGQLNLAKLSQTVEECLRRSAPRHDVLAEAKQFDEQMTLEVAHAYRQAEVASLREEQQKTVEYLSSVIKDVTTAMADRIQRFEEHALEDAMRRFEERALDDIVSTSLKYVKKYMHVEFEDLLEKHMQLQRNSVDEETVQVVDCSASCRHAADGHIDVLSRTRLAPHMDNGCSQPSDQCSHHMFSQKSGHDRHRTEKQTGPLTHRAPVHGSISVPVPQRMASPLRSTHCCPDLPVSRSETDYMQKPGQSTVAAGKSLMMSSLCHSGALVRAHSLAESPRQGARQTTCMEPGNPVTSAPLNASNQASVSLSLQERVALLRQRLPDTASRQEAHNPSSQKNMSMQVLVAQTCAKEDAAPPTYEPTSQVLAGKSDVGVSQPGPSTGDAHQPACPDAAVASRIKSASTKSEIGTSTLGVMPPSPRSWPGVAMKAPRTTRVPALNLAVATYSVPLTPRAGTPLPVQQTAVHMPQALRQYVPVAGAAIHVTPRTSHASATKAHGCANTATPVVSNLNPPQCEAVIEL